MLAIRVDAKAAGRLVLLALVLAIMLPSLAGAQSIAGVIPTHQERCCPV